MSDLSITAGSVLTSSTAVVRTDVAGASITAGQWLYRDASDSNKIKLAVSTNATTANAVGIALHAAGTGQPIAYQTSGDITIGGTVAVGDCYWVSGSAGGMQPYADLGQGEFCTCLGMAISTTVFRINITASGAAKA